MERARDIPSGQPPAASPELTIPWWKKTTVYQIYPRSFCDSNGDGIGDLQGIISKLDYLQSLGVETLWISPFFKSPQRDFGYDISDYRDIAPEYGTMDDCRTLIREVHLRGMKIVMDMVLNHTSDQHPWFLESRSGRTNPRRDWYIWRDGRGGRSPPNNWRSMLGGSGWRYDKATDQWYFATFLSFQPDLNYRNPVVKAEMLNVVRFWLREGADGLRLDLFNALFKDESFAHNPLSWRPMPTGENPHGFFQNHRYTLDHPDTLAFARELRGVVDEFTDPPRFMVGEVFGDAEALRDYCGVDGTGLHLVFLFQMLTTPLRANALKSLIQELERVFTGPLLPTYVLGNHDRPRVMHRLKGSVQRARLLAMLQLTARGVPFLYYGEEIGMANARIPLRDGLDPIAARFRWVLRPAVELFRRRGILLNRDECRTPMAWDGTAEAGFTAPGVKPWLPVGPGSATANVADEQQNLDSLLWTYRHLLALRSEQPALNAGGLEWIEQPGLPEDVLAFRRTLGDRSVDVYMNFSGRMTMVDLSKDRGRWVFSNVDGGRQRVTGGHRLQGFEGIAVLPRSRPA